MSHERSREQPGSDRNRAGRATGIECSRFALRLRFERGLQWIASALRERNPDGLPITLESPPQDLWRWRVAGGAVKTEYDERLAQRCGKPAGLAPVQKHESERAMFLRLHYKIAGMRIGVVAGAKFYERKRAGLGEEMGMTHLQET